MTLGASWENYSGFTAAAYRLQGNVVRIRGDVFNGATGTSPFTLPAGFRPSSEAVWGGGSDVGATTVSIAVSSAGVISVSYYTVTGTNHFLTIDGSFTVD